MKRDKGIASHLFFIKNVISTGNGDAGTAESHTVILRTHLHTSHAPYVALTNYPIGILWYPARYCKRLKTPVPHAGRFAANATVYRIRADTTQNIKRTTDNSK